MTRYWLAAGVCVALAQAAGSATFQRTASAQARPVGGADVDRAYRANNLGVAALEQFNYQDAEGAFREALKIHPALGIAKVNLAIALLYQARPGDAAAAAQEAVQAMPAAPQAHYVLGLAYRAENAPEKAVAAFEKVLELDPADAATKVQLGQIYLQQRRFEDALKILQQATASEPHNVTAAYNLALALSRSGQADEGRQAMQHFEKLRDSAYGVTYSQTYLGQGRYAEAIASTGDEADLVDPNPPPVRFVDATADMLPGREPVVASGKDGGVTLADLDDDGDLDLVEAAGSLRLLRNDGGRLTADAAALAKIAVADARGAVAGDYDNDGRSDLFVLREGGYLLLKGTEKNTFTDATTEAGLGSGLRGATAASFADLDHDGDLDIVVAGAGVQVLRNNGTGGFADITKEAGFAGVAAAPVAGAALVDFDNRRDVDVLLAGRKSGAVLFRNMRDGSFSEQAGTGLPAKGDHSALAIGDVNKDGFTDLFLARASGPGTFVLSDGKGRFQSSDAPAGTSGAAAAQLADYDNDGLLDLLTVGQAGLRAFRNLGGGRWEDASSGAGAGALAEGGFSALAVGDLDGDGDRDAVLRAAHGGLRIVRNDGGERRHALAVRLAGRVSNRSGIGAKLEMRAGSLRQALDVTSSTPAVTPADLVFGLGVRETADVVRVLWPSGILQAETEVPSAKPGAAGAAGRLSMTITELDRKPSSCPYLFTWNGTRFEFVTDFMGGGEMGAWLAPALWNTPDPDEYVRITGDQLRARDGRYELRVTNELEEALFVDRLRLIAVDHPDGVMVFPNEGLRSTREPFRLIAVRDARPPAAARDGHGHDVLAAVAELDRRYPDDFGLLPIRGYAEPHELVLDLGPVSDRAVLLLTGWTDYAFSNDNVAASQAGVAMSPPSLQVKDRAGAWRTVIAETGFPVGRPQTVVVDLAGKFLSDSREVRILTNMRVYWDRIQVAERDDRPVTTVSLEPRAADLAWRGLSAEVTPDGREPYGYDYARVSSRMPWKVMVGRYTREGDVRPLLARTDDLFVISRPGDEIALSFEAPAEPAGGRTRTFLLFVHGYSKEMNPRSALPDTVNPLPFRAMSGYPYPATEHYPRTRTHREYQDRWNTRVVSRPWPSLDVVSGVPASRQAAGETPATEVTR